MREVGKKQNLRDNPVEMVLKKTGLSQERLATNFGITRQTLSNYGRNPDTIPDKIIKKMLLASGFSYDQLFGIRHEKRLDDKFVLGNGLDTELLLELERKELILEMKRNFFDSMEMPAVLKDGTISEITVQQERIKEAKRKTVIAVVGEVASGKSSLVNRLLGDQIIPVNATTGSAVPVYILHKDDMPKEMKTSASDKKDAVVKFNGPNGTRYEVGEYSQILAQYAIYSDWTETSEVSEVKVYLDIDILRNITILDMPGIIAEPGDISHYVYGADIILFVTALYRPMSPREHIILKEFIEFMPELEHIMIIGSKNCLVGGDELLNERIQAECQMIYDVLPEEIKLQKVTDKERLKGRFCIFESYDEDEVDVRRHFYNMLSTDILLVAQKRIRETNAELKCYCEERHKYYSNMLEKLLAGEKKKYIHAESTNECMDRLQKEAKNIKGSMDEIICERQNKTIEQFKEKYADLIDQDKIVMEIKRRGVRNSQAAITYFMNREYSDIYFFISKLMMNDLEEIKEKFNLMVRGFVKDVQPVIGEMEYEALKQEFLNSERELGALYGISETIAGSIVEGQGETGEACQITYQHYANPVLKFLYGAQPIYEEVKAGSLSGNWEMKTAKKIIKAIRDNNYLEAMTNGIQDFYKTFDVYNKYISELLEQVKEKRRHIDGGEETLVMPIEALRVWICQSMMEMYTLMR